MYKSSLPAWPPYAFMPCAWFNLEAKRNECSSCSTQALSLRKRGRSMSRQSFVFNQPTTPKFSMTAPNALLRFLLPLSVAFGVLYLFGMRSSVTTIALLVISVSVLFFAMSSVMGGVRTAQDALDASERTYDYAGWALRVYADERGELWLRAADLKRLLDHGKSDAWLAKRYPAHYCKANPQLDAWYMHTDALRDYLDKSGVESAQRFLAWLKLEVIGMHRFEQVMAQTDVRKPSVPRKPKQRSQAAQFLNPLLAYFIRHWRGELGLLASVFLGGGLVTVVNLAVQQLQAPLDLTVHYRQCALIYVTQIGLVSVGLYWWGRGVMLSAQRWVVAERSLIVALIACMAGFGSVMLALSDLVETEKQYFLTDFVTIMLDADHKPQVNYDTSANRIILDGELGFGATSRVRKMLDAYPQARSIELKSYGGRTAEGFGLLMLIAERHLETYVRAECMSACVVAYIGGGQRYVASGARFGLHRSGFPWQAGGDGLNSTDNAFARIMRISGVDEAFIARGMQPSIREIYLPTSEEVLAAGLATAEWI
jgi:hypothetical protein